MNALRVVLYVLTVIVNTLLYMPTVKVIQYSNSDFLPNKNHRILLYSYLESCKKFSHKKPGLTVAKILPFGEKVNGTIFTRLKVMRKF